MSSFTLFIFCCSFHFNHFLLPIILICFLIYLFHSHLHFNHFIYSIYFNAHFSDFIFLTFASLIYLILHIIQHSSIPVHIFHSSLLISAHFFPNYILNSVSISISNSNSNSNSIFNSY